MLYLAVFVATVMLDYTWGRYVRYIADRARVKAAAFSVSIHMISAFVTISYVHDRWALLPLAFGSVVGTLLSVR